MNTDIPIRAGRLHSLAATRINLYINYGVMLDEGASNRLPVNGSDQLYLHHFVSCVDVKKLFKYYNAQYN